MDIEELQDAQLTLVSNQQSCVLPVTLPMGLLDDILANPEISMRLEFSDSGHVSLSFIPLVLGGSAVSFSSLMLSLFCGASEYCSLTFHP
jgi:hypothetical protein